MKRSTLSQGIGFTFLYLSMIIALISVGAILFFITKNGIKIISWEFLTGVPRRAMTQGGIAPALVGTFYLTIGAIFFALPFGVVSAVFLTEYSPNSVVVNIIRMSIN
ncbi:MAG: phosphate ABC transporter, permease protein PstA, partial [Candidatus Marinimicrobia bacterium]|nr:phosphate ABC transporter, permease protein PstA [Candidatus Neomarinimicrobiota bacterium]